MRYIIILLLLASCSINRDARNVKQSSTVNAEQLQFNDLDLNQDGNISEHEFKVKNVNVNTTAPWIGIVSIVCCVFVLTVGLALIYRVKTT
jgi:hypothetical protein